MNITASARPEFNLLAMMVPALIITLLLIYMMHRLVYMEQPDITTVRNIPIPNILFIREPPKTIYKTVKPVPPVLPIEVPATPEMTMEIDPTIERSGPTMTYRPPTDGGNIHISLAGDSVVQQVMIAPQYPVNALKRGVEGFVDVAFEVTGIGTTQNVRVVGANPEEVFDSAALRAVKRWKYLPREGENATVVTLQERIRFKIDL